MADMKDWSMVNRKTGECREMKTKKSKRTEAFFMTVQYEAIELAKMKLTSMDHRILLYLQGLADYNNVAQTSQLFLAEELGTTEATVSTCIKRLEKNNLLKKQRIRGQYLFMISNSVSTRGKIKDQDA